MMKKTFSLLFFLFCLSQPALAETINIRMQTSMGDIFLELDKDKAPQSVDNFMRYVDAGFYDGTIFHRVIDGFMIQGGGFTPDFTRKPTLAPVKNEADNGLKNDLGTIAMARTTEPHSATAQFFINVQNNDFLNFKKKDRRGWGYAVFGKVSKGMDIVHKIRKVQTGPAGPFGRDVPKQEIVIFKVTEVK